MEKISLKKNYIYRMAYEVLTILIPLLTTPYISRVLGADGVGIYSYSSSVMAYFTLFAGLGTATYGSREIAMCRDDRKKVSKLFYEIELLSVFTSLIALVGWLFVIYFSNEYKIYFLALLPTLLTTMFDVSWFFAGYEKINITAMRSMVCRIICVICLFAFVKDKDDLILYFIINSSIGLIGNLVMWTALPKMLERVSFKSLNILPHFNKTLVYFIPTIFTSLYTVLDKVLIGLITNDVSQNGYYEQANRITHIAKTAVFVSVNAVMGVRISYLYQKKRFEEIKNRINRSFDMIFLVGYAFAFGIMAVARNFVPVFFGEGYSSVEVLLYLMAPMIIITSISNCLGSQYYTPFGLLHKSTKFIVVGSCVNLALNLCMIPLWGAYGACFSSIIAEMAISFLFLRNCNDFYSFKQTIKLSWKRIIAGSIMFLIVFTIGEVLRFNSIVILTLQIAIGVLVYFVLLMLFKDNLLIELNFMVLNFIKLKIMKKRILERRKDNV